MNIFHPFSCLQTLFNSPLGKVDVQILFVEFELEVLRGLAVGLLAVFLFQVGVVFVVVGLGVAEEVDHRKSYVCKEKGLKMRSIYMLLSVKEFLKLFRVKYRDISSAKKTSIENHHNFSLCLQLSQPFFWKLINFTILDFVPNIGLDILTVRHHSNRLMFFQKFQQHSHLFLEARQNFSHKVFIMRISLSGNKMLFQKLESDINGSLHFRIVFCCV